MPENQDPPTAGFLGGQGASEPEKPKEEKKEAPPPPAPTPGAGVGFLGGAGAAPTPPPAEQPAAAPPPPPAAPPAPAASPPPPPAPAPAEAPPPPAVPTAPAEPPQPLPDPSAPASEFFTRAEELYDQGFLDSAITAYRRGLEKDPGNIVAANNLAMVYIDKERYEDARAELERSLSRGAEDAELLSNLGYTLRKLDKNPEAADVYERYLQANPDAEDAQPIRAWIDQVRAAAAAAPAAEEAPLASEAAPAAPALQPAEAQPEAPVFQQPAPQAPAAPEPPPGEPVFQAAPPPAAADTSALLAQADEAYDAEDYQRALELYDQVLAADVNSAKGLAGRGKAQTKLGLLEEGLASLREAAAMEPDEPETHYVMGFILRGLERDAEAADAYEKFLQLVPDADNAEKIGGWVEQVRASAPAAAEEEQPTIQKQPAWAQALEGPPEGAETAGLPETEATLQAAAEQQAQDVDVVDVPAPESAPAFAAQPAEPAPPAAPTEGVAAAPAAAAPAGDDADLEQQLDAIVGLLSAGDAAGALSQAQALVGQHPDCLEAKILIARAFGQQGEFPKALAILQNIVATQAHDEAYFFMGRCQQEMGKSKEARDSFTKCLEHTENPQLKERVEQLVEEMSTGDKAVCGACAQTVPAADLQEVDGEQVCTECRSKMEQAMGGQAAMAAAVAARAKEVQEEKAVRSKKRPRAQKKGSLLGKLFVLVFLLVFIVVGGMAGLYFAKPEMYEQIRLKLPAALPLPEAQTEEVNPLALNLPDAGTTAGGDLGETEEIEPGDKPPADVPVPPSDQALEIVSPALAEAIVGVQYEHRVRASGTKADDVVYGVTFSRAPQEKYGFDAKTGVLTWRPMPADMKGEPLSITFSATSGKFKAPPQPCTVRLRPPVLARALAVSAPIVPGEAVYLAAGDLTGDKRDDILLARGQSYWQGELILYEATADGFKQSGSCALPGRPVGVAIGNFGDGKAKALVVDYWNRRMVFAGYEGGRLAVLPEAAVEVPGRPALVGFGNPDGEGPMGVAVLCPTEKLIAVYDAVGGGQLSMLRQIPTPPIDALWKGMHLVDLDRNEKEPWAELALVRLGKAQPNVYIASLKEGKTWTPCSMGEGTTQAAATGDVAGPMQPPRPDLALIVGNRSSTLNVFLGQPEGETRQDKPCPVARDDVVLGLVAADLDGSGTDDLVFLLRNRIHFRLRSIQGLALKLATVNLPEGTHPPLGPAAVGEFTGDKCQDVVYLDRGGRLVLVSSAEAK